MDKQALSVSVSSTSDTSVKTSIKENGQISNSVSQDKKVKVATKLEDRASNEVNAVLKCCMLNIPLFDLFY